MSWNTLLNYIQALPNNVELQDDKEKVLIREAKPLTLETHGLIVKMHKPEPIITLSVEESHELIVTLGKSEPSSEVIDFLNTYLKENASDLCDDGKQAQDICSSTSSQTR